MKTDNDAALHALRARLWETIVNADSGRDVSALAKRWLDVTAEIGDKNRESLEELRDILASFIERSNSGRDIASLSIRLLEVLRELDAMPNEDSALSPLARAREVVRNGGAT